jgi:hypothetical protein
MCAKFGKKSEGKRPVEKSRRNGRVILKLFLKK